MQFRHPTDAPPPYDSESPEFHQRIHGPWTLARKLKWRWNMCRSWARYAAHQIRSPKEWADFALENHFFSVSQEPSELRALAAIIAQTKIKRALEIGTARGGTLLLLCRLAAPDATIISLDLPGGDHGGGYGSARARAYSHFATHRQQLHLIRADSHLPASLARVRSLVADAMLDYLFIDGDHSYDGVKKDFEMYSPLVRPGGLIAFHDIVGGNIPWNPPVGVPQFWRDIKGAYDYRELVASWDQGLYGIGLLTAK